MEQSKEWHYTDPSSGVQKGPVPAVVLLRLLEKGVGVNGQTLVWRTGMDTWLPAATVEPFASVIKFQSQHWYYVDIEGEQHGPITSNLLVHKLKEGDIDGLTLVYGGDVTEWKKVSEVQVLKDEMAKIAEDEERARLAFLRSQEDSVEAEHQVFVDDDDPRKAYELAFAAVKPLESGDLVGDGSDLKTYIADNGQRYVWDEEENDWVEADDEDEPPGVSAGGNTVSNGKQTATATGKRKAGDEAKYDGDEDSGDDAENGDEHGKAGPGDAIAGNNKPKKRRTKKKAKKGPNTWVYVTGLPPDITAEAIKDHFSKVGLIALSPYDQQPKIKIYREQPDSAAKAVDPNTLPCKGDCLICYNAEESVKLALDVLSGGYIRPNAQVTVTRADFTPGGNGDQGNTTASANSGAAAGGDHRRRPALSQAQVKVARSAIKQALTWNEDDDIGVAKAAALRIVVLEGLFKPSDFEDPGFSEELEGDLASECEKCGTIEKITLFSSNPRGIAVVKFSTSYAAQECIRLMNGRYFAGSKLKCYFWDGVTNYSITATSERAAEEEEQAEAARLDEFGDWLEKDQEDLPEEFRLRTE